MAAIANAAVSWDTPRTTNPAFRPSLKFHREFLSRPHNAESHGPARPVPGIQQRPGFLKLPTNSFVFVSTLITGQPCFRSRYVHGPGIETGGTDPCRVSQPAVCDSFASNTYADATNAERWSDQWRTPGDAEFGKACESIYASTSSPWTASCRNILQQILQRLDDGRIFFSTGLRPPPAGVSVGGILKGLFLVCKTTANRVRAHAGNLS